MTDDVAAAAAAIGATAPADGRITRPTTKAEWTLIFALAICALIVLLVIHALSAGPHPGEEIGQRVDGLKWLGYLGTGGMFLVILAFISPFVGTVRVDTLGSHLSIDGRKDGGQ